MKLPLAIIINIISLTECFVLHNRIAGGDAVNIENFKYQLSMILKTTGRAKKVHFTGSAVIVSRNWAVTTAHCVVNINASLFIAEMVYLRGGTSHWKIANGSHDHKVVLRETHPKYDEVTSDFDIALLKVDKPFTGRNEQPAIVAGDKYELPMDAAVVVSGWGEPTAHSWQIGPRNHLRAATLKIVDQESCQDVFLDRERYSNVFTFYNHTGKFTDRMICAWESGKDACQLDSGGPLVHGKVLIGLVSWGISCASPVYPGVYSSLSAFYPWLRQYEVKHHIKLGITYKMNKQ